MNKSAEHRWLTINRPPTRWIVISPRCFNFEYRVDTCYIFQKSFYKSLITILNPYRMKRVETQCKGNKIFQNYFQELFFYPGSFSIIRNEIVSNRFSALRRSRGFSWEMLIGEPIIRTFSSSSSLRSEADASFEGGLERNAWAQPRFEVIVEIIGLAVETSILYDP